MFKKALKNKKGFTLVELMVVVAILGVLVAVAVPVYNNMTSKAELSTIKANLRIINSAIMQADIDGVTPDETDDDFVGAYLQGWPDGPKGTTYEIGGTAAPYYGVAILGAEYKEKNAAGTELTYDAGEDYKLVGDLLEDAS